MLLGGICVLGGGAGALVGILFLECCWHLLVFNIFCNLRVSVYTYNKIELLLNNYWSIYGTNLYINSSMMKINYNPYNFCSKNSPQFVLHSDQYLLYNNTSKKIKNILTR